MKTEGKLMIAWTVLLVVLVYIFAHIEGHETYIRVEHAAAAEVHTLVVKTSAYTSSPEETDDTPTITASNTQTRDGVIANNCLAFGTKVKIGEKMFVVEDRMNRRYGCDMIDIWMATKEEALTYGVRQVTIQVFDEAGS